MPQRMTGRSDRKGNGAADGGRRRFVMGVAGLGAAAAAGLLATPPPAPAAESVVADTAPSARRRFMERAFELRRLAAEAGDQPYGAVVVKDGRVVGEGPSRVLTAGDPTAHAEVEAIRDAARRLGGPSLAGCEIYASSRPCPMCETACYWAGIARIYHGADAVDAGPPRYPPC
jgi:tRNA(Arg) A34 adenosine deaminase TadA